VGKVTLKGRMVKRYEIIFFISYADEALSNNFTIK
jgi:hypothetical protein